MGEANSFLLYVLIENFIYAVACERSSIYVTFLFSSSTSVYGMVYPNRDLVIVYWFGA